MSKLPCQVCGYFTIREHGSFECCPVCFWEEDGLYDDSNEVRGGPNGSLSLAEAIANYKRFGAIEERLAEHVRPPKAYEISADISNVPIEIMDSIGINMQSADREEFVITNIFLNDAFVFCTEERENLIGVGSSIQDGEAYILEADRNSKEMGDFFDLRIKRLGDRLELERRNGPTADYYSVGSTSVQEWTQAIDSLRN